MLEDGLCSFLKESDQGQDCEKHTRENIECKSDLRLACHSDELRSVSIETPIKGEQKCGDKAQTAFLQKHEDAANSNIEGNLPCRNG